jgi:uncharacterized protein
MNAFEEAVVFDCAGSKLVGILHRASDASSKARRIVVVNVVGGPQYRVGSHRQFALTCRYLSANGYPAFRFDYRGMGDSDGAFRTFESVAEDIDSALAFVRGRFPEHSIVLMGLCDGASAILMRPDNIVGSVAGIVLVNPWARTESSMAKTYTRHYYRERLLSVDFWKKVATFDWDFKSSIASAVDNVRRSSETAEAPSFISQMSRGFSRANVPLLIALSEHDLTAREFEDLTRSDRVWTDLMNRPNVRLSRFVGADHTFSSASSLAQFNSALVEWLTQIGSPGNRGATP